MKVRWRFDGSEGDLMVRSRKWKTWRSISCFLRGLATAELELKLSVPTFRFREALEFGTKETHFAPSCISTQSSVLLKIAFLYFMLCLALGNYLLRSLAIVTFAILLEPRSSPAHSAIPS